MKEEVKSEILRRMLPYLNNEQLSALENAIDVALKNADVIETPDKPHEEDHSLDSFLTAKRIEGCSEKTLRYYRDTIIAMITAIGKQPKQIITEDLRLYLTAYQIERRSSKVTIDNIRRILSSFFSALELMRDKCENSRDLAMIDLLASSGMRVGEMVALNRDDINFNERECVVFGKGNKERLVYFDARTKIHLQNYLDSRSDTSPALFVSLKAPYERLKIGGVEVRLRELGKRLNLPKVHPHKFRRTLATSAIDKGMPIEQVQQLLGHQKIDTTMHYAMVKQQNVKLAHRKYIG